MTKGQWSWVDWVRHRHPSSCQLLLKLFIVCQVNSDFDETRYE